MFFAATLVVWIGEDFVRCVSWIIMAETSTGVSLTDSIAKSLLLHTCWNFLQYIATFFAIYQRASDLLINTRALACCAVIKTTLARNVFWIMFPKLLDFLDALQRYKQNHMMVSSNLALPCSYRENKFGPSFWLTAFISLRRSITSRALPGWMV